MKRNSDSAITRGAVLMLLVVLFAASTVLGQEITGAITGVVTDPTGAVLVGANVTAKDADRGTTWKAQTNGDGVYNLPRLPIGVYDVRVEAQGFQTAVHAPFRLELNQTARVDVAMTLGQVTQQLEVTSSAPVLQRRQCDGSEDRQCTPEA
jgi:hypothetical protein